MEINVALIKNKLRLIIKITFISLILRGVDD